MKVLRLYWAKLIFFLACSLAIFGQGKAQELIATLNTNADFLRLDNLGNILAINDEEIVKFNKNGVFELKSSNKLLGHITHVDATNALKMYVFSNDLSQVQILDNKLGDRGNAIALDALGFEQVTAIAYSYNNGMWLYDQLRFELIRLDQNLTTTLASGNLISLIGLAPQADFMVERNKWLYVVDKNQGIFVFDIFGTYFKTLPIKGLSKIAVVNDDIYYLLDNKIMRYNSLSVQEEVFFEVENTVKDFSLQKDRLCVLSQGQLFVYKI